MNMRNCFTSTVCFSGAGLMDWAIHAAGGKVIQAIECDESVAAVHRLNFPGCDLRVDRIERIDPNTLVPTDHIHGSPECKRASTANHAGRETEAEDIEPARAFLAIIQSMHSYTSGKQPKWITLEQVRGYAEFASFGVIVGGLQALGYVIGWQVLNAADFGTPQNRHRLILRATLPECAPPFTQLDLFGAGELFPIAPPNLKTSWYQAIGHLIPTLPLTKLPEWLTKKLTQKQLLGEIALINSCDTRGLDTDAATVLETDSPAFTMRCWNRPESNAPKVLLVDGKNSRNDGQGPTVKPPDDRSFTLVNYSCKAHTPKLLLVNGTTNGYGSDVTTVEAEAQSVKLCASASKRPPRVIDLNLAEVRLLTPEAGWLLQMHGSGVVCCQWPEGIKAVDKWKAIGNGVPYLLGLAVMQSLAGGSNDAN